MGPRSRTPFEGRLAVSPPRLFLPPGTLLDEKYRVERFLGQGATGCVFLATHTRSGENLALKFVHPVDASRRPEAFSTFLMAARAAARFRSPNVAHVRDMGLLQDGSPFLVMDYLEGETLESHLRAQPVPLPLGRAVDIALQAARGLGDAHAGGVIHGNARPSKWFLTRTPDASVSVKILDFGASKIAQRSGHAGDTQATGSGPLAMPPYGAPEQIRSGGEIDPRTDIWTVGVVLHELLAGTAPFQGETIRQSRGRALAAAPHSLRVRRSDIAPELEAVVQRCLEKNPGERFDDMSELIRTLAPFRGVWERASVSPPIAVKASGPAPPPPLVVAEPALSSVPSPDTLASVNEIADRSGAPSAEVAPAASVWPVVAQIERPRASPTAWRRPRMLGMWMLAATVGVLSVVAGVALLVSPASTKSAAAAKPLALSSASANASSEVVPPAPLAMAASASAPEGQGAAGLRSDRAIEQKLAPDAAATTSSPPAKPAPRPRATKPATRDVATRHPTSGGSPPVGTAGFGDRQ